MLYSQFPVINPTCSPDKVMSKTVVCPSKSSMAVSALIPLYPTIILSTVLSKNFGALASILTMSLIVNNSEE